MRALLFRVVSSLYLNVSNIALCDISLLFYQSRVVPYLGTYCNMQTAVYFYLFFIFFLHSFTGLPKQQDKARSVVFFFCANCESKFKLSNRWKHMARVNEGSTDINFASSHTTSKYLTVLIKAACSSRAPVKRGNNISSHMGKWINPFSLQCKNLFFF